MQTNNIALADLLSDLPLNKESILKIEKCIVELKKTKRNLRSNKSSLKWMNPFHAKFEDNTSTINIDKATIQYFIDLCQLRIKEIKLNIK